MRLNPINWGGCVRAGGVHKLRGVFVGRLFCTVKEKAQGVRIQNR